MQKKISDLLERANRKSIDTFFIHQYIVRRFKHHYRNDYDVLLSIRHGIESILGLPYLIGIPRDPLKILSIEVTMSSMIFFEKKRNRNLLRSETKKNIRDIFCKHLNLSKVSIVEIECYLSEDQIDAIINILKRNLDFSEALISKYNIFDYYSIFSMTVFVKFDYFLTFYLDLFHEKDKESGAYGKVNLEALRRYPLAIKCEMDEREEICRIIGSDIYIAITSDCCNYYFYSSNVSVISDNDNDILINGIKSLNSIYLKVSVDKIPINIDAAILYCKDSIVKLLINNFGCRANIRDDEFESSEFMKSYEKDLYLVTQWNCINNIILGLWCWDIVKNERKSKDAAAYDIERIQPKGFFYKTSSILDYYDRIASILSLKNKEKKDPETLDKFVTGSDSIILGLRNKQPNRK